MPVSRDTTADAAAELMRANPDNGLPPLVLDGPDRVRLHENLLSLYRFLLDREEETKQIGLRKRFRDQRILLQSCLRLVPTVTPAERQAASYTADPARCD